MHSPKTALRAFLVVGILAFGCYLVETASAQVIDVPTGHSSPMGRAVRSAQP
jgi:hypothetical protein